MFGDRFKRTLHQSICTKICDFVKNCKLSRFIGSGIFDGFDKL